MTGASFRKRGHLEKPRVTHSTGVGSTLSLPAIDVDKSAHLLHPATLKGHQELIDATTTLLDAQMRSLTQWINSLPVPPDGYRWLVEQEQWSLAVDVLPTSDTIKINFTARLVRDPQEDA